jgi:DnaK suppressor protein
MPAAITKFPGLPILPTETDFRKDRWDRVSATRFLNLLSDTVVRHVDDLRADAACRTCSRRWLEGCWWASRASPLVCGVSRALRVRVHRAAILHTAALYGAGLAVRSPAPLDRWLVSQRPFSGGIMTDALHDAAELSVEPLELLRGMLEEEFAAQTTRLTELTVCARLPGRAGVDRQALNAQAAFARQRIADTAQALRRMSEGTYGICANCHKPIPLGRLRAVPYATYCTRCERGR